ncbi:MAG: TrkA C-terminal domain-containing protein [Eubacteriales bacterium]|nr:TrkA C-terminal domain-containing protein [Eubacteriales bacterium]
MIDEQMQATIQQLTDMAERFRYGDVMRTYEFAVPPGARIEGMSIAEIGFRTQTGATILAIRRGGEVKLSPPPEEVIVAHDVLVVVCGVLLVPVVSKFVSQV